MCVHHDHQCVVDKLRAFMYQILLTVTCLSTLIVVAFVIAFLPFDCVQQHYALCYLRILVVLVVCLPHQPPFVVVEHQILMSWIV